MSGAAQGPFRRDARVEITGRTLAARDHARAVQRARGLGLELHHYLLAIGLTTAATGAALRGEALAACVVGIGLVGLGLYVGRAHRVAIAKHGDTPVRVVSFRDDGFEIDAGARRSFWSWSSARGLRAIPSAIVLELAWGQALALEPDERLRAWLAARVGPPSEPPRARWLLLLAILYALVAAAAALILPSVLGPA